MRRPVRVFLLAALAAGPALPIDPVAAFPRPDWFRQHFAAPRTHVELQPLRRLADYAVSGKLELSLRAYIELALANNTDIALAKLQVEAPANAIERAYSAYDPIFTSTFSTTKATQTSINSLEGATTVKTQRQPFNATYTQLLPSGTGFQASFDASRNTTNYAYSVFNPVLSSNLSVGFEHQLLRDRGAALTKMNILVARSHLKVSQQQLRDQVTQLLAGAEASYWEVVRARENLALASKFVELRAAALDRAQRQVDAGALLPLDIYQPKSDYASARLAEIQLRRALAQRENALRQQIGADLDPAIRDLPIVLTEPLATAIVNPPAKEEAVQRALAARPDRIAAASSLETDDLGIRRATEMLRPSFSVTGSYESQGLGGTLLETGAAGGLADALSQMFHFNFPVYSFGVRLRVPVRDRAAAADLADAQVRKKYDALALRKLDQTVRRQVLDAVDSLEAARASLDQAQEARDYAEKRFAAEQKKYELGITQLFFVLTAQTSLNVAENDVLEQSINYRLNLVNLYAVMGQLLEERGVKLE